MNSTVTDIAGELASALRGGSSSARVTFGDKERAFAWTNGTLNAAISYFSSGVSESSTFSAMLVNNDSDVEAWTTGDKTDTATITSQTVTLKTYPGAVAVKTSDLLDSTGLGQAVNVALYGQALHALDSAVITDLTADGPDVSKAADLSSIAEAQANLMSMGFSPDLAIVSPTLYSTLAGSSMIAGGNDPQLPQQTVLGSRLVVSSALTGAVAIVADRNAVIAVEHSSSPVALLETHARKNLVDVVIEVVGGHLVTMPAGVQYVAAAAK